MYDEKAERIRDLEEGEKEFGSQTFRWKGSDYLCTPSGIRTIITPQPGTPSIDRMFSMTVRQNLFADGVFPKAQEEITFKNEDWRILQVDTDTFDTSIRLTCVEDNRGAHG